jgi:hypothetical protein
MTTLRDLEAKATRMYDALRRVETERDELRLGLAKYGRHDIPCARRFSVRFRPLPDECTCGLDALLEPDVVVYADDPKREGAR